MTDAPAAGSGRPRRLRHDPAAIPDPVVPPGPSAVDLHAHSRRSDGVLEPADLVRAAADCGVTTFALADHDTLVGYRELVADGAIPVGLELIPGIEINAIVREDIGLWEGELHILGLGMDTDDEAFEAALVAQRGRRAERFARTLRRLDELGMPVDAQLETLVSGPDDALGRPIIARALVAAGWASTVEDAFRRLIGKGTPGYVAREGLGPVDAIHAIRAAGGLAALAHFSDAPDRTALLRELMDEGLVGLEVYYRTFDRPTTQAMAAAAAELGLVPTGGTDYHGDTGTYAEAHAQLWVPPEVGTEVRERLDR
ncbi:MAG TPA: PHP domain-containing protein [Candidatus Limnocylindrales bacterium]